MWTNLSKIFSSKYDRVRGSACFRIRSIGTGVYRNAESVEQCEGAGSMFPDGHTCATNLEFLETSSVKVKY